MRIIQVPRRFVSSHWGGTETVILETCKRLLNKGHDTRIVCPDALSDIDRETIEGVDIQRVPYFYPYIGLNSEARRQLDQKGGNLFSTALMKVLNQENELDLIHLHTGKRLGGIGRHVALKRGIPYVISLHGGVFDVPQAESEAMTAPTAGALEWGKLLGWWVGSRRVFDDAAAIICVGAAEQIETKKRYPNKEVIFLPNGVDPDRFARGDGAAFRQNYAIPSDAPLIMTVGRIDPQKNQRFAIELMASLRPSMPDIHLALIGPVTNDSYFEQIKNDIKKTGLDRNITIIPGLAAGSRELTDAYHAADVFFLPSVHEPFGIVILEAWAAGLPVIAARVGGIPSFVEDGRDGILINTTSLDESLQAVNNLLADKGHRQMLSQAGRNKAVSTYSWDKITDDLIHIYESAIKQN